MFAFAQRHRCMCTFDDIILFILIRAQNVECNYRNVHAQAVERLQHQFLLAVMQFILELTCAFFRIYSHREVHLNWLYWSRWLCILILPMEKKNKFFRLLRRKVQHDNWQSINRLASKERWPSMKTNLIIILVICTEMNVCAIDTWVNTIQTKSRTQRLNAINCEPRSLIQITAFSAKPFERRAKHRIQATECDEFKVRCWWGPLILYLKSLPTTKKFIA